MEKKNGTSILIVKTSDVFKSRLRAVSGAVDKDMSGFVRDAVNEKIEGLIQSSTRIARVVKQAEKITL